MQYTCVPLYQTPCAYCKIQPVGLTFKRSTVHPILNFVSMHWQANFNVHVCCSALTVCHQCSRVVCCLLACQAKTNRWLLWRCVVSSIDCGAAASEIRKNIERVPRANVQVRLMLTKSNEAAAGLIEFNAFWRTLILRTNVKKFGTSYRAVESK